MNRVADRGGPLRPGERSLLCFNGCKVRAILCTSVTPVRTHTGWAFSYGIGGAFEQFTQRVTRGREAGIEARFARQCPVPVLGLCCGFAALAPRGLRVSGQAPSRSLHGGVSSPAHRFASSRRGFASDPDAAPRPCAQSEALSTGTAHATPVPHCPSQPPGTHHPDPHVHRARAVQHHRHLDGARCAAGPGVDREPDHRPEALRGGGSAGSWQLACGAPGRGPVRFRLRTSAAYPRSRFGPSGHQSFKVTPSVK